MTYIGVFLSSPYRLFDLRDVVRLARTHVHQTNVDLVVVDGPTGDRGGPQDPLQEQRYLPRCLVDVLVALQVQTLCQGVSGGLCWGGKPYQCTL